MNTRIVNIDHQPGTDLSAWGMIPAFISPTCEKPMWEQVHENYSHGGGWHDFDGFEVSQDDKGHYMMQYPGDPVYHERSRITVGDEMLVLFNYSWLLWVNGDEQKIARID